LLNQLTIADASETVLLGRTENVARGGVCLLGDRSLPSSSILRCELLVPGTSIGVPTLMQVQWARKVQDKRRFRIGLRFLI